MGQELFLGPWKTDVKRKGNHKFDSKTLGQSWREGVMLIKGCVFIRCSSKTTPLPEKVYLSPRVKGL